MKLYSSMIIARFCDSSKEYIAKINYFFTELKKTLKSGDWTCRECQGRFGVHSYYGRWVIGADGVNIRITIMQIRCLNSECGKTEAVLPDFVMPYKRYSADVIESVLLNYEKNGTLEACVCGAENSTFYRWIKYFGQRGECAANSLSAIFQERYDSGISLIKLIGKTLLERLATLLEAMAAKSFDDYCVSGRSGVISAANVILSRYGSGYI